MHFFPRSLGGQAMEWFSHLPLGIKTFDEIANLFVQQYLHNIKHSRSVQSKEKSWGAFRHFSLEVETTLH